MIIHIGESKRHLGSSSTTEVSIYTCKTYVATFWKNYNILITFSSLTFYKVQINPDLFKQWDTRLGLDLSVHEEKMSIVLL